MIGCRGGLSILLLTFLSKYLPSLHTISLADCLEVESMVAEMNSINFQDSGITLTGYCVCIDYCRRVGLAA